MSTLAWMVVIGWPVFCSVAVFWIIGGAVSDLSESVEALEQKEENGPR